MEIAEVKEQDSKPIPKIKESALKLANHSSLAELSIESYNREIGNFNAFCEDERIDYGFKSFKLYLENRKQRGDKANSLNLIKASIKRGILQNARNDKERAFINGLFLTVKNEKRSNIGEVVLDRVSSHSQLKELFEFSSPRMSVVYRFIYLTGCRVSEAVNCFARNIKESARDKDLMILEIKGKGSKWRSVYLSKVILEEIQSLHHSKEGYLFSTLKRTKMSRQYVLNYILRDSKAILNRGLTPHDLRHSFATHQVKNGESIKALSLYLGHSNTSITEDYYIHNKMDSDRLKSGFNSFNFVVYKERKRGRKTHSISR